MPDEDGKMTEAEAIAEVVRLGKQLDENSSVQTAWYALRIGIAMVGLGIVCLLMLFAYTVMSKSEGIPTLSLFLSCLLLAAGSVTLFWGLHNARSKQE